MSNPTVESLLGRRTWRTYDPNYTIPKETLDQLIKVALQAPTGKNQEELEVVVMTNRAKIDAAVNKMLEVWPQQTKEYFGVRTKQFGVKNIVTCDASAIFLVVLNEKGDAGFTQVDAGIQIMSVMAAARSYGLETMVLGCLVMIPEGKVAFEQAVGLPAGKLLVGLAVGKPGTGQKPLPKVVTQKSRILD
jgi:nitroreductase